MTNYVGKRKNDDCRDYEVNETRCNVQRVSESTALSFVGEKSPSRHPGIGMGLLEPSSDILLSSTFTIPNPPAYILPDQAEVRVGGNI